MKNRTVLIIAHKLSTVQKADKIAVIENGQISEIGNHNELIKKQGRYKDFYDKQFLTSK